MDLGAYMQISKLGSLAKANNISISRCRGYRLMKDEEPVDIKEYINGFDIVHSAVNKAIGARFTINPDYLVYGDHEDKLEKRFIDEDNKIIRWDRIHGKKRKVIKYYIKQLKQDAKDQFKLWNKYCRKEDVLYIHARLGRNNWSDIDHYYYKNEPWYLDSTDDWWDPSYCDIYAKIDPNTINVDIKETSNGED